MVKLGFGGKMSKKTEKDPSTRTHTQRKDKAKISLSVDSEIYAKSHALGINVSKACENYLKELINAIEGRNNRNLSLTGVSFSKEKPMAGGEGFEPSTPNLGGWCSLREDIRTKREPPLC